ncbi:flavin monoamine oxidase family protein [Vampirovibrio chlorellavorus]|uniref:flavin monoamine oxidase family protein n=1 Tax=Vampirovibrio chlorellavorus TaxID=758823 RepID=UPI0026EE69B2|nr:NAD(P)/FAD-dependent oxidoreductase [Vampirovibrio chlorellavorus]
MARTTVWVWLKQLTAEAMAQHLERPLTRRQFLKGLSGTALTLGGATLGLAQARKNELPVKGALSLAESGLGRPRVIIVGGGLAGLVSAYRLTQLGVPCEIYEASHRVGGRVFTRRNIDGEGLFVELGGELVDTNHEALIGLCTALNVSLERFPSPGENIQPALFMNGSEVRTEQDVIQAFQPLAKALAQDLERIFPDGEVRIPTYREPCGAEWLDQMSLEAYLDALKEVPEWLRKVIKAAYVGEYGLDPHEQSALNLLLLIDPETSEGFRMFGESDEAMRIQGGNSTLVDALYAAIRDRVPVHFGCKLSHVNDNGQSLTLTFHQRRRKRNINAGQVILATPFSVLRQIGGLNTLGLSPRKLRAIREWGYGTNSKQMLMFNSRFWLNPAAPFPANTGELFTDWPSQCYWETSRLQAGKNGILTNFLGGGAGLSANGSQWRQSLADLEQLFKGQATQAFTGQQILMNWSRHPWAKASYSCPRPGQYTSLMGAAGEPELNDSLFFAGEHCSVDWAGFMNGAVESGLLAAEGVVGSRKSHESRERFGEISG